MPDVLKPVITDSVTLMPWSYKTRTGITLRGYETPLSGKPIVHFVHGNGFNGLVYWPMLKRLLPHLDIVLTNAQGHGGSDVGQHFLGWNANAHMVHEVLQHKRQQWGDVPVIGMGHSFGGIITTLVSNLQPASFNQLILLDPIYLPRSLTSLSNLFYHLGLMKLTPMVNKTMKRRGHWPDRDSAHASFHQRGVFRGWHDEALNAYIAHGLQEKQDGVHLVTPPWYEASVYARYANGLWAEVKKIPVPCHVIYGSHTFPYVSGGVQRACKLNRHVTGEMMQGDHCFMQQHPQEAAERVIIHLDKSCVAT